MKDVIKKIPIPICGVMLGAAALGNLLQSYSEGIRYVCGVFAAFLLILALLKLIMFPGAVKEDMKNPIMASVSGTFPMALMILSTYVKPFIGQAAYYIWLFAIALHIVLIIYFTVKFVFKLQMPKVFASYYIVYVGIVVASVTAPACNRKCSILVWICDTDPVTDPGYIPLCDGERSTGSGKTTDLYLCGTDKPLYRRICTVCHAEILRIPDGNVCSCNGDLHLCTCKSNRLFEDAILPKLCGIHLPICHQCDRFKTDDGMCNEYGTSDAVPEICGIDRDDYCGCSGCVYLYPIYGIYLWRKEINKIIKNNKEWLLVVGQPLFMLH